MPPRFDPENLTLEVSVADLLEANLPGHLGFAQRGGYERLWLGQAIHSHYQEKAVARDPSYRREVPVALSLVHKGWEATIRGRIDGLRRDPDGRLVVEEVKSVRRGGRVAPAVREIYGLQAKLYAWILHRLEEAPVRAELVWIEIGSGEVEREEVPVPLAAVEGLVRRRLGGWIRGFESDREAAAARRRAAADLSFPYPGLRPGQGEIVAGVETALQNRDHLLVQAPTGIGKTVAALYPALRHALTHDLRLFVLTAKTLQQEMATAVLELLNREGAFHSLRLRAKAKMCANDQVLCHEEYCRYARDYYLKLESSRVVPRLLQESCLDPDRIFAAAQASEVCPFEVSLDLARQAQVVVCDYNYAFDPYISLQDFGPDRNLADVVLVIDELHNLVDRGRGYYSPELPAASARRAVQALAAAGSPLQDRVAGLCQELAALIEETVEEGLSGASGDAAAEAPLPEEALWGLRPDFDDTFVDYLEYQRTEGIHRADDAFVALYFEYLRFLDGLVRASGDAFSHLVERLGGEARLKILCKDPSALLGATLRRTHSVIGLSATLSPPEFYRDLLGFEAHRTSFLALPNPFPAENRQIVLDATVATTWRERPANYPRIAARLAEFAAAVPGNCLALFPSYEFLAEVARRMPPSGKRLLIQESAAGDREREILLSTLRSAVLGDVLLLAVAGGVFAEGVDYPGETLKAVAVVGPCLPAVSVHQELLKGYYQDRFERGFEYAYVLPGMIRVLQAAGRLIRSGEDTGVIALFDRRFLARPYRDYLPEDWLPPGGPEALVGDPAAAAREFFARLAPSEPSSRRSLTWRERARTRRGKRGEG